MKNTLIRAFVLALAVTGFGAATIASHARTTSIAKVSVPSVNLPTCAPNDPRHCGLD